MSPLIAHTLHPDNQELEAPTQQFHLASLMAQLIDDMMPFADAYGVNLSLELSPRALNTFVGDPCNLSRAAICIVRHAIGRVPGGRVKAKVLIDDVGHTMRFEVCDNGPFYQESDTRIATHLGGTLTLKEGYVAGGLVRIDLPLVIVDPQIRPPIRFDTNAMAISILCVDYDRPSQQALKAILETLGYDPDLAFSYDMAAEAVQTRAYDLILVAPLSEIEGSESANPAFDNFVELTRSKSVDGPMIALMLNDDAHQTQMIGTCRPAATLRKPINLVALLNLLNQCAQPALSDENAGGVALAPAA
jgi:hypothetical protein